MNHRQILENRIAARKEKPSFLDAKTHLGHFALINYALPKERLLPYIPQDKFEISEFIINGRPMALMSAVPFLDLDFHFTRIFPFLKFQFPQTNYRVYVKEKESGSSAVWFFGTTLGSCSVYFAKYGFRMPWHFAKYEMNCNYNDEKKRYERYSIQSKSSWASFEIEIIDTGVEVSDFTGFSSFSEMKLILTHPVTGFFYRNDSKLSAYKIWHEEMNLTVAKSNQLYFSLYERMGLLSKEEMIHPHSIFLCPKILFEIYLPPKLS